MNLGSLRRKIDKVDTEILSLIGERMKLALETAKFKPAIRDAERERMIVARLQTWAAGSSRISPEFIAALYGLILRESRRAQEASLSKEVRP